MYRFFVHDQSLRKNHPVTITNQSEIHHIKNVLRLKSGSRVRVFDGNGQEAEGTLLTVEETGVSIQVQTVLKPERKTLRPLLVLACAIPKKAKFKAIIEKCTELGIDEIVPLETQRTEAAPKHEKIGQKTERFQTIAINASKQCQRTTVPTIRPVIKYEKYLEGLNTQDPVFIFHLNAQTRPLRDIFADLSEPSRLTFLIGPEGDFTEKEIQTALKAGCHSASLGPTTLKVDTAAIAATAYANLWFRA